MQKGELTSHYVPHVAYRSFEAIAQELTYLRSHREYLIPNDTLI